LDLEKLILTIHAKDFCEKIGRNSPDLKRKIKTKKMPDFYNTFKQAPSQNIERLLSFSTSIPVLLPNLATASCG
jgi:hypothetical protein